jgi:electron transfer flavoprotein alpha subunit
MSILTYALHYQGEFNKNSLGAVSEAGKLAGEIGGEAAAVVVGEGDDLTDELCATLGQYGASKVYRAKAPEGLAQPVVDVMAKVIQDEGYKYALFGGGLLGFEVGAGLTARLGAGVTMEVTAVKAQDGKLVAERPILQDSAIVDVDYVSEPGIIIGRLNAFDAQEPGDGSAEVVDVDVQLEDHSTKARMVERGESGEEEVNIEEAEILVAGSARPRASSSARSWPAPSVAPSQPHARWSTPAGTPTRPRSARPARRSRPSSTWPRASPGPSSTRSECRARRTSSQ